MTDTTTTNTNTGLQATGKAPGDKPLVVVVDALGRLGGFFCTIALAKSGLYRVRALIPALALKRGNHQLSGLPNVTFDHADLGNPESVRKAFDGADAVQCAYLAGLPDGDEYFRWAKVIAGELERAKIPFAVWAIWSKDGLQAQRETGVTTVPGYHLDVAEYLISNNYKGMFICPEVPWESFLGLELFSLDDNGDVVVDVPLCKEDTPLPLLNTQEDWGQAATACQNSYFYPNLQDAPMFVPQPTTTVWTSPKEPGAKWYEAHFASEVLTVRQLAEIVVEEVRKVDAEEGREGKERKLILRAGHDPGGLNAVMYALYHSVDAKRPLPSPEFKNVQYRRSWREWVRDEMVPKLLDDE